jgi:hypothetical protein
MSSKQKQTIVIAIIAAGGLILAAIIGILPKILEHKSTSPVADRAVPVHGTGRLAGTLTDRAGKPISDMSVSIRNGPETRTDIEGRFVLNNVAVGDQLLEVQSPSEKGSLTQTVTAQSQTTTPVSIIYDVNNSRLGLLSITAPVDDGLLDLTKDGNEHRGVIYGRCDGLSQILGRFDVWVLISSQSDSRFWVQHPPAVVDQTSNTWHAKAVFGSLEHPPRDGERWDIVAISGNSESEIGRVLNTTKLTSLPPHIASNVVNIQTKIIR